MVNSTGTFTISNHPDLSVCQGASNIQLSADNITGASYSWTGPGSFTSTQQNPVITGATTANAGQYVVTVSTQGCGGVPVSATDTILVSVQMNPTVTAVVPSSSLSICENTPFTLAVNAVTGAGYSWTGPGSFSSSQMQNTVNNASINNSGTYVVTVSLPGCDGSLITSTASVSVSIMSNPAITITPVSTIQLCPGDQATLSVTSITGATYNWTGPNSFSATTAQTVVPAITNTNQGAYTASVHVANGCIDTVVTAITNVNLKNLNGITVSTSGNQVICQNEILTLTGNASTTPSSYSWVSPSLSSLSTNATAIISNFSVADTGTYVFTVNFFGCTALNISRGIHISLEDPAICNPETGYYLPSAFSPNGDGHNDMLWLYGNGIESMDLKIYDRWGNLVFYSDQQSKGWDGAYKGDPLNTAVFAYQLAITFKDGTKPVKVSGNLSLIR